MKKVITLSVLFLAFAQFCLAQVQYFPRPENEKFEGKWRFANSQYVITITLKNNKQQPLQGFNITTDIMKGGVMFVKNNKTVFNKSAAITYAMSSPDKPYILNGDFSDDNDGAAGKLLFSFNNPNDLNKLRLTITPFAYPKGLFKNLTLRIPKTLELERVSD